MTGTAVLCRKCGKAFMPRNSRQLYCCRKCRVLAGSARYYYANREKCLASDKLRYIRVKNGIRREPERARCDVCGANFIKRSSKNMVCSDACRAVYRARYMRSYNAAHPYSPNKGVASVRRFYDDNPHSIYMPDRAAMVGLPRHKFTLAKWRESQRGGLTVKHAIALANAQYYIGDDKVEKIDLETLKGLPSEHKDAIIKALFDALKAKKAEEVKPKERKMTQKGVFFIEVDKLKKGEYIPLFELMERAGVSKNEYMKQMNIFNALKMIPEGVIGISVCKTDGFPEGWLDEHIYRSKPARRQKRQ